jgi:uncharacterized membrane protein
MEPSVEQRVTFLEARVKTLEGLLAVTSAPTPVPAAVSPPLPAWSPPRKAAPELKPKPEPKRDLEELLGGRVLGLVGGVAVVIAAVFFVVMAVRNGWIGEAARMELAFAASAALVGLGIWLYERRGQTQAALATVAAGLAALYISDAATTLRYHLVSPSVGLVIAGAVGALALGLALRWNSQEIAGIGIVGSLLAPIFVDAGTSTSSLVFMTIALLAAIGVVVWRGWAWLAVAAYVVSAPQAADWLSAEHNTRLGLTLAVTIAFWLLYVVAALGHELRTPTESLRLSSASLLLANAVVTAAGGWWLIDDAGHRAGANAWLFALAGAHIVLGTLVLRSRASREIAQLLYGVAAGIVGVAITVSLNGPAVVAAWSFEALVLAWAGRRTSTPERGLVASLLFAGLAAGHVLVFEVRPDSLAYGVHSIPVAIGSVGLVLLALTGIATAYREVRVPIAWASAALLVYLAISLVPPDSLAYGVHSIPVAIGSVGMVLLALAGIAAAYREVREPIAWAGAAVAVYLASCLVVDLAGASPANSTQTSQLALSGFWGALGLAAILAGLVRRKRELRFAGLGILALAVGKVFLVDLAHLESIWRVGSFLAIGLLLLAGAFAYQRARLPSVHDRREAG